MRYSIRVTDPPGIEPLTLEEAKAHLRIVDDESQDDLVAAMLAGAVEMVERRTSYVLTDREMEIAWEAFPCLPEVLSIPREPVTEASALVYDDGDGVPTELVDYRWSASAPEQVLPGLGEDWPVALGDPGSVRLTFRAGHEVAAEIPPALLAAVKLMLGHLWAHREAVVTGTIATELPLGVEALCGPFRRMAL